MRRALLIGAALIAMLTWALWRAHGPATLRSSAAAPDTTGPALRTARLFFASTDGDSLVSEARDLAESGTLHERVATLVAELARGPRGAAIPVLPAGTAVLHVYLDDRGLMTLDLTRSFLLGFRGGSTAEYLAVASLTRTLGANLPDVRRVQLICGGETIASLGGHLPLDRPLDVQDLP